jgi:hypothetical protein
MNPMVFTVFFGFAAADSALPQNTKSMTKDELVASITVDGKKWGLGYANFFDDSAEGQGDNKGVFVTVHQAWPDDWTSAPNFNRLAVWGKSGDRYALLYESPSDINATVQCNTEGSPRFGHKDCDAYDMLWASSPPEEIRLSGVRLLHLPISAGAGGPAGDLVKDKVFLVRDGGIHEVVFNDEIMSAACARFLKPGESIFHPDDIGILGDGFQCDIQRGGEHINSATGGTVTGKLALKGDIDHPETLAVDVDTTTLKRFLDPTLFR